MKLKILLIIVLITVGNIFAQTDDITTLKELNQKIIDSYKAGDLDNATKFAKQSLDLNLKVNGAEHIETAIAYTNLGVILRDKRKFGDSIENLQKALEIYQKNSQTKSAKLLEMYQLLALSQDFGRKNKEAEATYLKALNLAETKFGAESKEIYLPTLYLANHYARFGETSLANENYLKSFKLAKKNFGDESKEVDQVSNSRVCLIDDFDKKKSDLFDEEFSKIFGLTRLDKSDKLVNGKAKSLIKPRYPDEAKKQNLTGITKVRIKINEEGNVIEAKSACGDGILENASVEAAKLSKFSPTLLNGKPTKVTGIIVYKFARN